MDDEQKAFLERRFADATKRQPELRLLRRMLLKLGGQFVVAPSKRDPDLSALLESGFVMGGPVKLVAMKTNSCHQNLANIWRTQKFGVIGIGTGYVLTEDQLWRQHSWGVLREGILETTKERTKYFGILLQGSRADRFARFNQY
jgi:hypothetical protein